ncbi:MAG: hypothetical protein NT005_13270 [Spirochaetes bacterium]|nr:hypothetical protein [Spirochaetota bacterium]
MRKFALPICLFFLAALSYADVSDTVWKALLQKSVIVVTTDGSEVSGELAVVESDQVVVIKPDGEPVVVERDDVRTVRAKTAASGSQSAKSESEQAGGQPGEPEPTKEPSRHFVMLFNPIGNVLSSVLLDSVDISADLQFALSKSLAIGVEPEIAVGDFSGFGVWGGVLFFPMGKAPEGLFIKVYGGYASFEGWGFAQAMAAVGYQFIWGGFVFSPDVGLQYFGEIGFHWRLNIGFAL